MKTPIAHLPNHGKLLVASVIDPLISGLFAMPLKLLITGWNYDSDVAS